MHNRPLWWYVCLSFHFFPCLAVFRFLAVKVDSKHLANAISRLMLSEDGSSQRTASLFPPSETGLCEAKTPHRRCLACVARLASKSPVTESIIETTDCVLQQYSGSSSFNYPKTKATEPHWADYSLPYTASCIRSISENGLPVTENDYCPTEFLLKW